MTPTISEVLSHAVQYRAANRTQRVGQAAFNAVYEIVPDIADALRGTDVDDPFYDDAVTDKFIDAVWNRLEEAS